MDPNGNSSHSNESKPSRGSKNEKEDKKSTEKDVHDSEFVNHAEIAWHENRRAWVGIQSQKSYGMPGEPIMSLTTTYEELLLTGERFHQPIPLAEMVDFLVDIWLDEGLFD